MGEVMTGRLTGVGELSAIATVLGILDRSDAAAAAEADR
jgi:hypothetical protein